MSSFVRSSPSFVIAVGLLVVAATGYAAWRVWWPSDVVRSDRIVRQFAKESAAEVQSYRRELRQQVREVLKTGRSGEFVAGLEKRKTQTLDRVTALADRAGERIDGLARVPLRTERNRFARIAKKFDETKALIAELTEEARTNVTRDAPATP